MFHKILKFLIRPIGKNSISHNLALILVAIIMTNVFVSICYEQKINILSLEKNYYKERYEYWNKPNNNKLIRVDLNINTVANKLPETLGKTKFKVASGIIKAIKKYNLKNNRLIYKWLNPDLIISIITIESRFNIMAKSNIGAIGLMQVRPSTARWLCKKYNIDYNKYGLYDPEFNTYIGTVYMCYLANTFKKNTTKNFLPIKVLVAYNEGPNSSMITKNINELFKHKYPNLVLKVYNNNILHL